MDLEKLHPFTITLVMIGMVVAIGILIFNGFAVSSVESTTITNESLVWLNLTNTTTLAHGNITTFTQILNSSGDAVHASNYTVTLLTGSILINGNTSACEIGDTCYAYYTYDEYDTPTENAMTDATNAIAAITSDWLAIIVIIGCLAVIITLVIVGIGRRRT